MTKPCTKCGATDRNASGACRPCQAARSKAWSERNRESERARKAALYQADREKVIARSAAWAKANAARRRAYLEAWNAANREKLRLYSNEWRARNPDARKRIVKAWAQRNPDRIRAGRQNRRARVVQAPGRFTPGIVARLRQIQRGKCACCNQPLGRRYELDHILPLALGGSNTDENAQLLRAECNRRKGAKHPVDYMQSRGKLL